MSQEKKRVAVVGGGISGLAAAHRLAESRADLEITVLEANEKLGGILQTESADGFCLELGPDSLLSRLPWGLALCEQLGLHKELINTNATYRGAYVVRRGELQRVPEGLAIMAPQRVWPLVRTPILSWRGKLRLAAERWVPRRKADEDESLADFSRRRLGREMFERLVQPLAGGIYMGDPEQLSVRATFPQFVQMEATHGSLTRAAFRGQAAQQTGGPDYSLFVAPRRGTAQLIEALAARLGANRVRCGQRVDRLVPQDHGWSLELADAAGKQVGRASFAGVILAVPAYQAGLLLARVAEPLSSLLAQIPYAGCVVVNLAYPREAISHPLDSFGFVVPHLEQRAVLACTFSSVKYAERAPEGKALLRAFLGGACFPEVIDWPDERVLRVAQGELGELLGIRQPPLFTRITRWRRAMPQYHLGHVERVERVDALVEELPNLELAGNAYHGVGIPHCIRVGQEAGSRLLEALNRTPALQRDANP